MPGSFYNLFSIHGGSIVQLDDILASLPKSGIRIELEVDGETINVSATGDTGKIARYRLDILDGNVKVKSIQLSSDTTSYNLSSIGEALGVQFYSLVLTAYGIYGNVVGKSENVQWYNTVQLPECEPMTLRIRFGKSGFAPVDEETGTSISNKGTWKKVETGSETENLWDWTYNNPDWTAGLQNAFNDETNLVDIVEAGDTSVVTQCSKLFNNSLTTKTPADYMYIRTCCLFDTSNVTTMDRMFKSNTKLVYVPKFDTSKVTDMSYMFYECYELASVPLFDTSNVTNMCGMLCCCETLTSVPLFNTSNVTNMSLMLCFCTKLTSVPLFDTSNVTDMSIMFRHCDNLTTVPLFDTSNVTTMEAMFNNCQKLTEVPKFDTRKVTNMYGILALCYSLKSIPYFDTRSVTNMKAMLNCCDYLTEVPKLDYSNVTTIEAYLTASTNSADNYVLEAIPDLSTITNKLNNCKSAFRRQKNVKYGILEAYNILKSCNPTTHALCFELCGINTEEGLIQLWQIPEDWGGLSEVANLTIGEDGKKHLVLTNYKSIIAFTVPCGITVDSIDLNWTYEKDQLGTLYVPFEIDADEFPEFTFYTMGITMRDGEYHGDFKQVTGKIEPNTPLAVKSNIENRRLSFNNGPYRIQTGNDTKLIYEDENVKISTIGCLGSHTFTSSDISENRNYFGISAVDDPEHGIQTGDFVKYTVGTCFLPFSFIVFIETLSNQNA